jgi:NAD(P)-dependent dehydrogenase (short-subunit alcohol dehydrogenase family)
MDTTKTVLVTGASTGIGRKLTEHLAALGCLVYAAVRKDEDIRALAAIPRVVSLRMDVTSPSQVAAAVDLVTRAGRGLYGLVNNAGIATMGNIVDGSDAEFNHSAHTT